MSMSQEFIKPKQEEWTVSVGGPECDIKGFTSNAVQLAVDLVKSRGGGTVKLGAGEFAIMAPIRLYDHIALVGSGESTILRKIDGFKTRFVIDADYGELKAMVEDVSGFKVGMGIQLYDALNKGNWHVTTAVITAIEDQTIHFDQYLVRDYLSERDGAISNACSIIEGVEVKHVHISDLIIDGNKEKNEAIDGCRGGGIYLHKALDCVVENVKVRNFSGDGISWQITNGITVRNCEVHSCTNFGLHPGTGSLHSIVEACDSHDNGSVGLFICWRVQQGVFKDNKLHHNGGTGISIGHKDTDNVFENNHIYENAICGVLVRSEKPHNGAHRNKYIHNRIENNGNSQEGFGFLIQGMTDDILIQDNIIRDTGTSRQKIGIMVQNGVSNVRLHNNELSGHSAANLMEE